MNIKDGVLEKIILDSIKQSANEFQKDELAYLALTSKIENPIRDKWAYLMWRNLKENIDIDVAREWIRPDKEKNKKTKSDIAIVQDNRPIAIIELKAMYTFDLIETPEKRISDMEKDKEKAKKIADKDTLIYTVLLATYPLSSAPIPEKLKSVIKYYKDINKNLNKFEFNPPEIYKEAKNNIEKLLENKNIVAQGILSGGKAFNIDADVAYWIIRA